MTIYQIPIITETTGAGSRGVIIEGQTEEGGYPIGFAKHFNRQCLWQNNEMGFIESEWGDLPFTIITLDDAQAYIDAHTVVSTVVIPSDDPKSGNPIVRWFQNLGDQIVNTQEVNNGINLVKAIYGK